MTVVGDTMTVVYANKTITGTRDKGSNSFEFSGTVEGNPVYPDANLSNLKVTVTPGENGEGDTVKVEIPAELIPLRNYSVNTENGQTTMSTDAAYPIRIFYNVGQQAGVDELLAKPDTAMTTYINNNLLDDGKVAFYSNAFKKDQGGNITAGTTATFTPASSNKFYYFTENTPLYRDKDCTNPATAADIQSDRDDSVYYKNEWYEQNAQGRGDYKSEGVAIPKDVLRQGGLHASNWVSGSDGNIYMKQGVARLSRTNDFRVDKAQNVTETASQYISPDWNGSNIVVSLGNNGRLAVERPASLAVSKTVTVPEGFDLDKYANTEFAFNINVDGAPDDTYQATVKTGSGEPASVENGITFKDGKASYKLTHNQTLTIYGLPAGATYAVTEEAVDRFTTTYTGDTGTLTTGQTSTAAFTNEYGADPYVLDGATYLDGAKILTPRDWLETDSFTFQLLGGTNPMPEGAQDGVSTITLSGANHKGTAAGAKVGFNFGNITFDCPGVYEYTISELEPETNRIPGMTYSKARYVVTVTVTDEDGALDAVVAVEKTYDDAGAELNEPEANVQTATFTNTYSAGEIRWAPSGTKSYKDNSGKKPLTANMFHFRVTPTGDNANSAPLPAGATDDRVVFTGNDGSQGGITFEEAAITADMVGQTFTYEIVEVIEKAGNWVPVSEAIKPDGDNKYVLDGMTYDSSKQTVTVKVSADAQNVIQVEATYSNGLSGFLFTNSYTPTPVTLEGDAAIHGSKTLTGRDMLEGEVYTFTLTGADAATQTAMTNGAVKFGGESKSSYTAEVKDAANGVDTPFNFGSITIAKPGKYVFNVKESVGEELGGMTYDDHTSVVTVEVTDENGVLSAAVSYSDNADGTGSVFENEYISGATFAGLNLTKTLTGRAMVAGEFRFTVAGQDDASIAKLNNGQPVTIENTASNAGQAVNMPMLAGLQFNQDDAGKTFTYLVDETEGNLTAVTYDKSQYRVEITVTDDGKGKLTATPSITRVMNSAGATVDPGDSVTGVAFTNEYKPASVTLSGNTALQVTKRVMGAPIDQTFDFTLTLTSDNPSGVAGLTDGKLTGTTKGSFAAGDTDTVRFGDLTFTQPGTYTFTVQETAPAAKAGWTWDTTARTITVNVTNQKDGEWLATLDASDVVGNNPTVTNSYEADPVTLEGNDALMVNKQVTGHSTEADPLHARARCRGGRRDQVG